MAAKPSTGRKPASKTKSGPKLITERKTDDGTKVYDFRCPHPQGCGIPGGDPFSSTGWADREHAVERGKQHIAEHQGEGPMQSLHDFRVQRGLTPDTAGLAVLDADWEF